MVFHWSGLNTFNFAVMDIYMSKGYIWFLFLHIYIYIYKGIELALLDVSSPVN